MAVKVIADTTSGLPFEYFKEHDVPLLPQIIMFGEDSYRDDTDLDIETFLNKLRTSPLMPKTAAPPPALYEPVYKKILDEAHTCLVVAPSADMSGTVRSAEVGAQEFSGADIHIFDTRFIAGPLATMVNEAVKLADEGKDVESIKAHLNSLKDRMRVYFMVDTLEYLERNGRIGGASALIGKMLDIKPILTVKDGKVDAYTKERTHKKALKRLCEIVEDDYPRDEEGHLAIMHGDALDEAKKLADHFKETLGVSDFPIYELPPVILTHAGPGVLAVSYLARE